MSYTTRFGRTIKLVNYSDTKISRKHSKRSNQSSNSTSNKNITSVSKSHSNPTPDSNSDLEIISNETHEQIIKASTKNKTKKNIKKRKKRKHYKTKKQTSKKNPKKRKKKIQLNANPSSSPTFTQPPPKKKRKTTPSKPEKRLARLRILSQKTKERLERARNQRLFMINANVISDIEREYAILGSTGNVYTIIIGNRNSCTCPDFRKGNVCKHILFVMIKVLRVRISNHVVYQKALLNTELHEIFENAPNTMFGSDVTANNNVCKLYQSLTGDEIEDKEEINVEQKPLDGDCPICMEKFIDTVNEAVVWCRSTCGQNIHRVCFKQWEKSAESRGNDVTCVYCRSAWFYSEKELKKKGRKRNSSVFDGEERFLNLGAQQGMSTERDTSSYHDYYGHRYRRRYNWW